MNRMQQALSLHGIAYTLANEALEAEALATLQRCPSLRSYVCAMGTAFFVDKHGQRVGNDQGSAKERKAVLRFEHNALDPYQNMFDCSFNPVRLDRVGSKIERETDW